MKNKIKLTSENDKYYNGELYYDILNQENIYINSLLLDKEWYRRIFGGEWRLIKLGKDTPDIGMFCIWTKLKDHAYSGYIKVLQTEIYPITRIYDKRSYRKKFIIQYFKNIFN
jgi:hypothetical protein